MTKRLIAGFQLCLVLIAAAGFRPVSAQPPNRLAILNLQGDEGGLIAALMRESARSDRDLSLELVDEDLIRAALRGAGYEGSLNLSRAEARALGQSLGCDFFILGKVQVVRRLAQGEQFFYEALAGLMLAETRTGKLLDFAFERSQAQTEAEAQARLKEMTRLGWRKMSGAIAASRARREEEIVTIDRNSTPLIELLTDQPEGQGINPPLFYQRLKPVYTEQAELAGITATVELEAVFREDGTVGQVEIMRWAGFGLDQSAAATVRLLKFKPAERDGKKLSIRAVVRYNFRRPLTPAVKPQAQSQEEIDRLRRSLRNILKPR